MNILITVLLVFELCNAVADSARILGVFQMPAVSHQCVFQPVWRELSLRGHQVTVVTAYPLNDPSLINLTEIDVRKANLPLMDKHGFQFFMNKEYGVHTKIPKIFDMNNDFAESIFNNEEFKRIYTNSEAKFDLVIAQTYLIPTLYSLAARFGAPLVGISSMGGWIGSHYAMGNPNPPSLYSEMFLPFHGSMTFPERFKSTLYNIWVRYFVTYKGHPECDRIARKYLGDDLPYIADIEKNMSLLLLTTSPILYEPRPTVPTVISIEQMHVRPAKSLPKDLQEILDSAKKGVVYFSLGSNVKSVNTSQRLRNNLIDAFSELAYKILWKFEGDSLVRQPKNVIIRKWLPQQDILAHPNVKAFFTQCGLQSVEEAIARGVPIVGLPFIADQEMNVKRLVEQGVAVGLDFVTATKKDIKKAVIEVAENQRYRTNMKNLGELWADQPMKSIDRAIWWIEYVIRHKGTKHLRSPTADVSWSEYFLLDVIAVMICIVSSIFYILFVILKVLFKKCFVRDKEKQQ